MEHAKISHNHGKMPMEQVRKTPLSVSGVGKGSQTAQTDMILPMAIPTENMGTMAASFTTPLVPDADLPGILGLDSMADLKVIIDVDNRKFYIPGKSPCKVVPGEDTAIIKMEVAPSGHVMIPCDNFDGLDGYDKATGELNLFTQFLQVFSDERRSTVIPMKTQPTNPQSC